jgi:hypothetical protein
MKLNESLVERLVAKKDRSLDRPPPVPRPATGDSQRRQTQEREHNATAMHAATYIGS